MQNYRINNEQISTAKNSIQHDAISNECVTILQYFKINANPEIVKIIQWPQYAYGLNSNTRIQVFNLFGEIYKKGLCSAICYRHLAEYCKVSKEGVRMYLRFFDIKNIKAFLQYLILLFIDKQSIIKVLKLIGVR